MQYKIGDHVVIEESNVESFEKFAGRTGVIDRCSSNSWSSHPYSVIPDGWTTDRGVWCRVKCLVKPTTYPEKIVITHDGKTTKATLYHDDMKTVATARCAPEDTFDFNVGAKLAMERLMEAVTPVTVDGFKVGDRVTYFGNKGTVICINEYNELGVQFDTSNPYAMHNCGGFILKAGKAGEGGMCKWADADDLRHIDPNEPELYNGKVVCVEVGLNYNHYTLGKIYEFVDGTFVDDRGEEVHIWRGGERFTSFEDWKRFSGAKWLEIKE